MVRGEHECRRGPLGHAQNVDQSRCVSCAGVGQDLMQCRRPRRCHNRQGWHGSVGDEAHARVGATNMPQQHSLRRHDTRPQRSNERQWLAVWMTKTASCGREKHRNPTWTCVCPGTRLNRHRCRPQDREERTCTAASQSGWCHEDTVECV